MSKLLSKQASSLVVSLGNLTECLYLYVASSSSSPFGLD